MKKYKKLLMVAPLACMLGTGIFTLPDAAHAEAPYVDQNNIFRQGTYYTKENLTQSLYIRFRSGIEHSPELRKKFNIADDESVMIDTGIEFYKDIFNNLQKVPTADGSKFEVSPHIDSYEDLGQTNLLTINNDDGIVAQQAQTPETTETFTETMSYSNQTGQKLGIESTTSFKVNLPFNLGGFDQSIKIGTEFTFNQSSSNTSTHETSVTFKSQPVVAAPGGTTTYYGTIKKAKFSGTFQTDSFVTGGISLDLPIAKKDSPWKKVRTEKITLNAEDVYAIYKNDPYIPLPSYIQLNDQKKRVILKNAETFTFNGEGGYYSAIQVKFIPKDPSKQTQVMPYKEYVAKAQEKSL
ncbi:MULTISPECIES: ETX/MTX2 family pore-forming toxin [unclassified Bacillus (in: firmicutes)]|uniref:ETX/MTX2 family pore-forming toxin n=1 Tax=unclassified Bacillus (in: firmicutes) TaxID=185979 RepID=UPI0008E96AFA|nr:MULTISPECIES: ETX/MTX2 family pore-forming toxin [unclassified Bacillus (in: firmicutes)]SFK16357.1 toxin ETX/toxin MTX2 [Bacillus sp. 71mf]SFT24477.1 toxin ETX/toxin MTX2 [Bacillus sp. 103mf]